MEYELDSDAKAAIVPVYDVRTTPVKLMDCVCTYTATLGQQTYVTTHLEAIEDHHLVHPPGIH